MQPIIAIQQAKQINNHLNKIVKHSIFITINTISTYTLNFLKKPNRIIQSTITKSKHHSNPKILPKSNNYQFCKNVKLSIPGKRNLEFFKERELGAESKEVEAASVGPGDQSANANIDFPLIESKTEDKDEDEEDDEDTL